MTYFLIGVIVVLLGIICALVALINSLRINCVALRKACQIEREDNLKLREDLFVETKVLPRRKDTRSPGTS